MHQDTKSARLIAVCKRSYKYYIVYKICPRPEEQVLGVYCFFIISFFPQIFSHTEKFHHAIAITKAARDHLFFLCLNYKRYLEKTQEV